MYACVFVSFVHMTFYLEFYQLPSYGENNSQELVFGNAQKKLIKFNNCFFLIFCHNLIRTAVASLL